MDSTNATPEPQSDTPPAAPASDGKREDAGPPRALALREPLPFRPRNMDELFRLAQGLARANLLPKKYHRQPDNLMLALLKGEEMGLTPMQSIGHVNVIDGKAEVDSHMAKAKVLASGKCRKWKLLESTETLCRIHIERVEWDPGEFVVVEYTFAEARRLGLDTKGRDPDAKARNPWVTQPRNMLLRRCSMRAAREEFPDVIIAYDTGELREMDAGEDDRRGGGVGPIDLASMSRSAFEDAIEAPVPPADDVEDIVEADVVEAPPPASGEYEVAPPSTDKLFLAAFDAFRAAAEQWLAARNTRVSLSGMIANPHTVVSFYEGLVADVADAKGLQSTFELQRSFRSVSGKSEDAKTAAAGMASVYAERQKSFPPPVTPAAPKKGK